MRSLLHACGITLFLSTASCTDRPEKPSTIVNLCEIESQHLTETTKSGRQLTGEELGSAMHTMSDEIDTSEVPVGRDKFVREGTTGGEEFGYYHSSNRYEGPQLRYFTHEGLICKFMIPGDRFAGVAAFMERADGQLLYVFPYGTENEVRSIEINSSDGTS